MWLKMGDFVYNLNEDTVSSIYISTRYTEQFEIFVMFTEGYFTMYGNSSVYSENQQISIMRLDDYDQAKSYLNTIIKLIQCKHIIVDSLCDTIKEWMS